MPPRHGRARLEDIREAIEKIRRYTRGLDLQKFLKDEKTIDAVVHNLSVIGEAVGHLPDAFKKARPSIPWQKITGMRNLMVHEYFRVSPSVLWQTIESELHVLESISEDMPGTSPIRATDKVHPWRMCPSGYHPVRTHALKVPPSRKNPKGQTVRHFHCARNPSGKDSLSPFEIDEIAAQNFEAVKERPCSLNLGFKNGTKYDGLISGWTKYWNEVLRPDVLLDPNLVKALIASESRFEPAILANKKNPKSARGLMQVTEFSRVIMADLNGELKDHFVDLSREDLDDPNLNLCAGIRWLIHKFKKLPKRKAGSWEEAVWEYKGLRSKAAFKGKSAAEVKAAIAKIKSIFHGYHRDLIKCEER